MSIKYPGLRPILLGISAPFSFVALAAFEGMLYQSNGLSIKPNGQHNPALY